MTVGQLRPCVSCGRMEIGTRGEYLQEENAPIGNIEILVQYCDECMMKSENGDESVDKRAALNVINYLLAKYGLKAA